MPAAKEKKLPEVNRGWFAFIVVPFGPSRCLGSWRNLPPLQAIRETRPDACLSEFPPEVLLTRPLNCLPASQPYPAFRLRSGGHCTPRLWLPYLRRTTLEAPCGLLLRRGSPGPD